ncbi:CDP-glycerol glycerophosphotransferase family protein [Nocardioides dilutus]
MKSLLRYLAVAVVFALNTPLYLISRVTPRDRALWVFGAWFGKEYADNPRYLAEFIRTAYPTVRCVWLCKSEEAARLAREHGLVACKLFSIRGYWYTMRAAIAFTCTGRFDINYFVRPPVVINLWHGIPLKKIVADDDITAIPWGKRAVFRAFPHFSTLDQPVTVSSDAEAAIMASAFRIPRSKVFITGSPRNDVLSTRPMRRSGIKIAYLPTHRGEGAVAIHPLTQLDLDAAETILARLDAELLIKVHHYHARHFSMIQSDHVRLIGGHDIGHDTYGFLDDADILLTDYSSVYLDYLLTDRPVIFAPFDLNSYVVQDRELNWDYADVTPGPKCTNWPEVFDAVTQAILDPHQWSAERARVRDLFHAHRDRRNAERVFHLGLRLIDETATPKRGS